MSLTLCILASGSKGNALWAETPEGALLLDCGLGPRELPRRLAARGLDPRALRAVLVTHEHADHARGLPALAAGGRPVVHLTRGTYRGLGGLPGLACRRVVPGVPFVVAGLRVVPHAVPHDAREPVAYRLEREGLAALVVTDLGTGDALPDAACAGLDWALVEANHDERWLREGPYPAVLKARIASGTGHLSNRQGAALLARIAAASPRLRAAVLGHLSEVNNAPGLARDSVLAELEARLGAPPRFPVATAAPDAPGRPVRLAPGAA